MKNFILVCLVFISFNAYSQVSVDGVDVNKEACVEYITMTAYLKPLTANKYGVVIDYGQKMKFAQEVRITDKEGKPVTFNGAVDALNFLDKNGWELVSVYTTFYQNVTYFNHICKRKEDF